jgi:Uma2 family endonuclease/DNA-binding transcriptional regulator YdaS (Cro superfamily)
MGMTTALQLAVKIAGGQTALAAKIGRTQGHISKWLQRNFIPPDAVLAIERATGIPRSELRPDLYPEQTDGFAESAEPITSKQLIGKTWTVAEIDAMEQAGLLVQSDHFELIDGEIIPMNAKGALHEHYKVSLNNYWIRQKRSGYSIAPETTFRLSERTFIEPDFVFYDSKFQLPQLASSHTLLAVEVSDTTLKTDLGRKAEVYARFAIPVLWVMDVNTLNTHVFEDVVDGRYRSKKIVGAHDILVAEFAPELALKLSELELI